MKSWVLLGDPGTMPSTCHVVFAIFHCLVIVVPQQLQAHPQACVVRSAAH